jgi:hypothetical protein
MASAGYGQRAGAVTLHTATCCREVLGDLLLPIRASGERTGSLWLRQSRAGCLATQGERGRGSLALAGWAPAACPATPAIQGPAYPCGGARHLAAEGLQRPAVGTGGRIHPGDRRPGHHRGRRKDVPRRRHGWYRPHRHRHCRGPALAAGLASSAVRLVRAAPISPARDRAPYQATCTCTACPLGTWPPSSPGRYCRDPEVNRSGPPGVRQQIVGARGHQGGQRTGAAGSPGHAGRLGGQTATCPQRPS